MVRPMPQQSGEMQQSVLGQGMPPQPQEYDQQAPSSPQDAPYPPQYQEYQQQGSSPEAQAQYQGYQSYDSYGASADMISEIAEQVVNEKLSKIRTKFDEIINFKVMAESKIDYLDERLKRIEKIIDRLQLSVLQKVGEYITNVEDIKKEMQETQKSLKSLASEKKQNYKELE